MAVGLAAFAPVILHGTHQLSQYITLLQGSFTYPQPPDVAHPDGLALLTQLQMHGVIVTADRSTGTITLQRPAQPQVSTLQQYSSRKHISKMI